MSNYGYRNAEDEHRSEIVAIEGEGLTMSPEETRKYKKFLVGLSCFIGFTILTFSPFVF
jgi:hypothetical protein